MCSAHLAAPGFGGSHFSGPSGDSASVMVVASCWIHPMGMLPGRVLRAPRDIVPMAASQPAALLVEPIILADRRPQSRR